MWGENECSHGEDVGLCCWGSNDLGKKGKRKGMSFFPRCPSAETPEPPKDPEADEEDQDEDQEEDESECTHESIDGHSDVSSLQSRK